MGKSARKNKQKKKDFQKVKLKAGKTKPKADNFTDTTFKSRAIQIRDQLKSSEHGEGEPVTERKQSLQDLLIQLNHYNSSVRSAALLGIKSLLTSHSNLLHAHLSTLIPALSAVTSDKDPSVRRTGSSLLRVVMANLSANQMSPFFQAVCTHLCCAMTHIQEDIQLDSLEVMESILQHYPGLVAPHSKALLPNFIHLISQQQSKLGGAGATGSKLKVNPSGKLSGQKWRLKVLQMLQKLLEVAKETKGRGNGAGGGGGRRGSSIKNVHSLKPVIVATETSRPAHVPMMRTAASLNFKQKQIVLRDDQSVAGGGGDFLSDPTSIREVCHTLIPLMLQCWGEVNLPARGKQAEGWVTLGKQEAETLHCVLSILQAVWELLERACTDRGDESALNAVRQTYQRKLQQHFEQGFPYSCHSATPAAKHTKKGPPPSRSATPTNLAACNLLLSALPTSGNRSRHWMRRVRGFVVDVLQGNGGERERLSREELLLLIRVVKQTVENADSYEERNFLIDVLFGYYQDAFPLSQQKLVSLGCISELCVDTVTPDEANRSDKLREFFQSVGHLVCEARDGNIGIAHEALGTLLKAASRGFYDALDCIQENIVGWMDHKDSRNSPEAADFQRRVIECLFYLPSFDNRLLASLTNHCCRPDVDVKVPIYILVNRCFENVLGAPRPLLSHADLMELLLSVSIGHSQESLATFQAQMQSDQPLPTLGGSSALETVQPSFHIVLDASKAEDTQRFAKINKTIMAVYWHFPRQGFVSAAVTSRMSEILRTCSYLPVQAVCSILAHAVIATDAQRLPPAQASPQTPPPPAESGVDSLLGGLLFVVLCRTVLGRRSECERGEETLEGQLWQLAVGTVAVVGDSVVDTLLQQALDTSKDGLQEEVGALLVGLLQTDGAKGRLHHHGNRLHTLIHSLEEQGGPTLATRRFAELKYEVSLLPRGEQTVK